MHGTHQRPVTAEAYMLWHGTHVPVLAVCGWSQSYSGHSGNENKHRHPHGGWNCDRVSSAFVHSATSAGVTNLKRKIALYYPEKHNSWTLYVRLFTFLHVSAVLSVSIRQKHKYIIRKVQLNPVITTSVYTTPRL
jgi:hypothetical protein